MTKFTKEQVEFIAKWVLAAAFDRIESYLPDNITLEIYEKNENTIGSCIQMAMDTAAMTLAIFYAQTTNEGRGIYDWSGSMEFRKAVEDFVAERTNPNWQGLKPGELCHPDTESFAKMYANEWNVSKYDVWAS